MDTIRQPRPKIGAFDKLQKASEFTIAGVEDSIPLRVLVQIFVFISIGAMDTVAHRLFTSGDSNFITRPSISFGCAN